MAESIQTVERSPVDGAAETSDKGAKPREASVSALAAMGIVTKKSPEKELA
jgi:hypothetical protein